MTADALGISVKQLTNYVCAFSVICVMLGIGQSYITQVIGVLYPAFMSFVALESAGMDDDK